MKLSQTGDVERPAEAFTLQKKQWSATVSVVAPRVEKDEAVITGSSLLVCMRPAVDPLLSAEVHPIAEGRQDAAVHLPGTDS